MLCALSLRAGIIFKKKTVNKVFLKILVIFSYDMAISDSGGCNIPFFSVTRMGNSTNLLDGM